MAHDLARESGADGGDEPPELSGVSDKRLLNRRNYLRLGAAAAGTIALASGGAAAATTRHRISFDRVVDAVDDLGWDPDGNDPIDIPTDDGLLIEVPPGEYVFEGTGDHSGVIEESLTNWGIRGTGDHWTDVVFRTSNGKSTRFTNTYPSSEGILLENISFDNTSAIEGGDIGIRLKARDGIEVHDVEVLGMSGKEPYCRWTIYPSVHDSDGVANIVNFRKTGPSVFTGHGASDGAGGVFPGHDGTNNFIDCRIENQGGDGGMYTGKHEGSTNFYDCYFANNDMAIMRMGAGSEMRGCTVVADWDDAHPDNIVLEGDHEPSGMNGLYFSTAQFAKSGGGVYDTDIVIRSVYEQAQAAIAINTSEGNMEIKNCRIQCDIDGMAGIWGRAPPNRRLNHPVPDKPWDLTIENCSFTGTTDGPAIQLDERHGSAIRNCCIQMDGPGDGIVLEDADDCVVEGTNINTNGQATVFRNCSASTSDITYGDSCPVPDVTRDSTGSSTDSSGGSTDDSTLPNTLAVEGTGERASYSFSVDGALTGTESLNAEDGVEGTDAFGVVVSGTDRYEFEGAVTDFTVDGPATVYVDGEVVDHTTLGDEVASELLEITGEGERVSYDFSVDGAIEGTDSLNGEEEIDGTDASGVVLAGTDAFAFGGSITAFSADGPLTVAINGEVVDHTTLGGTTDDSTADDSTSGDEHALSITGTGERATYEFGVTGRVEPDPETGSFDPQDTADGDTASGAVVSGTDGYLFTGDVADFSLNGPATVRLDGEEIDPAALAPSRTLTVVGSGEPASYSFSVSGAVVNNPDMGSFDSQDNVSGPSAEGAVVGGTDGYLFSGDVENFDLQGEAVVYLDGEQVSPDRLGTDQSAALPNVLVVDGTGISGQCDYEFTVDGAIAKSPDLGTVDSDDVIDAGSVVGTVEDEADAYRFSGDVTSFDMSGSAAIRFEDND